MKRIGNGSVCTMLACGVLAAATLAPLAAGAADQASIYIEDMPTCLTPGQKVTLHARVTNTGTVPWTFPPQPCPPGVTPKNLPGTASDCRHALGYFMNGKAIRGDFSNVPLVANIGQTSLTLNMPFCASDTTASRSCDASNPPLPPGTYTVDWQVVHEWVAWLPNTKTFTIQVKNSCGGSKPPGIPGELAKRVFFDAGIEGIWMVHDGRSKEYLTGDGAFPGNGVSPATPEKDWYLPALPAHRADTTEWHYKICCRPLVIFPPREAVTEADAKHWGNGTHRLKTKFSIDPGYWADGPSIAQCTGERIWTISAFTWDFVQSKPFRIAWRDNASACVQWTPTAEDVGKTFVPQCHVTPEGGWRQGDYSGATEGVDDLFAMYPRIHVVASEKSLRLAPAVKSKVKK